MWTDRRRRRLSTTVNVGNQGLMGSCGIHYLIIALRGFDKVGDAVVHGVPFWNGWKLTGTWIFLHSSPLASAAAAAAAAVAPPSTADIDGDTMSFNGRQRHR